MKYSKRKTPDVDATHVQGQCHVEIQRATVTRVEGEGRHTVVVKSSFTERKLLQKPSHREAYGRLSACQKDTGESASRMTFPVFKGGVDVSPPGGTM